MSPPESCTRFWPPVQLDEGALPSLSLTRVPPVVRQPAYLSTSPARALARAVLPSAAVPSTTTATAASRAPGLIHVVMTPPSLSRFVRPRDGWVAPVTSMRRGGHEPVWGLVRTRRACDDSAVEYAILAPREVRDGDRVRPLGARQQRALLALLLLHANEALTRDRLIDELWGEEPPRTAAKALQGHVSTLRRLLEPGRTPGSPGRLLLT